MKHKPTKQREKQKSKNRCINKHPKPSPTNNLPVNLLSKNSNGTSNWDQLSKIIGYDVRKSKMPCIPVQASVQNGNSSHKAPHAQGVSSGLTSVSENVKKGPPSSTSSFRAGSSKEFNRTVSYAGVIGSGSMSTVPSVPKDHLRYKGMSGAKKENLMAGTNQVADGSAAAVAESVPTRGYTKYVAMDCEMVGTGENGKDSMIARVSIVNRYGDCIYDSYVKPVQEITDFRTPVSGIRPSDLKNGKDLFTVQADVLQILENRVLVGHAVKNDLDVLFISHPKSMIRDTSRYKPFRQLFDGRTPSLKKLAEKLLGVEIQTGEHSSVEDAQAAMQVYLAHRHEWEKSLKARRKQRMYAQRNTFAGQLETETT